MLTHGNANGIVIEMAGEVLPIVTKTPVLAGVNGTDPFMIMPVFLRRLKDLGVSAVQNFPTVGIIGGTFRKGLEATRIFFWETPQAHELDLLATPCGFDAEEAIAMTEAGADFIVPHMCETTGGTIGATSAKTLAQSVLLSDESAESARSVRKDMIMIAHGGPTAPPGDVAYVVKHSQHRNGCNGCNGATSLERLPTEVAIKAHVERYKQVSY
jgi:predicted TIM-barrel enzyme